MSQALSDLVGEELKTLPFVDETTSIFEPREREQMMMFVFSGINDVNAYKAYVGFVLNERKGVLEIHRVGVHKDYQSRGWGRAIVECLERIAKKSGYNRVRVKKNRNPSFWKHVGYSDNVKFV